MKLRNKILLLAAVPLLIALAASVFAVRHQTLAHAQREKSLVESAWLASKRAEVANYVQLARSAIDPLLNDRGLAPTDARLRALELLARMEFGTDGYFFVYDLQGRNLMHPRQPELVGQDLSSMLDRDGRPVIRSLLAAARDGGEHGQSIRYLWQKPSSNQTVEKLGHVMVVEPWQWMIGTGLYLDDIDQALARIDATAQANVESLYGSVIVIASLGLLGVAASGLALNISDHRQSDAKLRRMAQQLVHSQEDERARLSRELHDGVSQRLVSIKLLLEALQARLRRNDETDAGDPSVPAPLLDKALSQLEATVREVRQLSHQLRPTLLDDLGLASALAHLIDEQRIDELRSDALSLDDDHGGATPPVITLQLSGRARGLASTTNTALFRIAQEALTNALRHASARHVTLHLTYEASRVALAIIDDGRGFDLASVQRDPDAGIGLRNMHERVEALGGVLHVVAHPRGTRVTASVPTPKEANPTTRSPVVDLYRRT